MDMHIKRNDRKMYALFEPVIYLRLHYAFRMKCKVAIEAHMDL